MRTGYHGVTAKTPDSIVFGAGTIHRGLKFSGGEWNFAASLVGATSGGCKISIVPEITTVEVDGVTVKTKGLQVKTGETATMEVNMIELTSSMIASATFADSSASTATGYTEIASRPDINEGESGDYWENIAFVGVTMDGRQVIAVMENALCTSGLNMENKNKEGSVVALTFECHAAYGAGDRLESLPWRIYYPAAGKRIDTVDGDKTADS